MKWCEAPTTVSGQVNVGSIHDEQLNQGGSVAVPPLHDDVMNGSIAICIKGVEVPALVLLLQDFIQQLQSNEIILMLALE